MVAAWLSTLCTWACFRGTHYTSDSAAILLGASLLFFAFFFFYQFLASLLVKLVLEYRDFEQCDVLLNETASTIINPVSSALHDLNGSQRNKGPSSGEYLCQELHAAFACMFSAITYIPRVMT